MATPLPGVPAVLVTDPASMPLVLAGIDRAGAAPQVEVRRTTTSEVPAGTEVVVEALDETEDAAIAGARLLAEGARPLLALDMATDAGLTTACLSCLARLPEGLNVPVPVIEDESQRGLVWAALREAGVDERLHPVEVDGRPALDELASRGTPASGDPLALLAAGAAGVLAGRMAAGNRRWRMELS